MEKPLPNGHRNGVALLITLITVAMMMVMIATLLSTLDSVRQDAKRTEAMIQANIYYSDIATLFKTFPEGPKSKLFGILYTAPIPFAGEDGGFAIDIACRPMTAGININWLGIGNDPKMQQQQEAALKVFDGIAANYNLRDPQRLLEMLLEEIGKDDNRFVIKEQSRLWQKRGIISSQQLERILQRYELEADDPAVALVAWEKLFSFAPDAVSVEGDYMSAELVALLFDEALDTVQEEWFEGVDALETFLASRGEDRNEYGTLFSNSKEFRPYAQCSVGYAYREERYKFSFVYMNEEIKRFEFYGRQ